MTTTTTTTTTMMMIIIIVIIIIVIIIVAATSCSECRLKLLGVRNGISQKSLLKFKNGRFGLRMAGLSSKSPDASRCGWTQFAGVPRIARVSQIARNNFVAKKHKLTFETQKGPKMTWKADFGHFPSKPCKPSQAPIWKKQAVKGQIVL